MQRLRRFGCALHPSSFLQISVGSLLLFRVGFFALCFYVVALSKYEIQWLLCATDYDLVLDCTIRVGWFLFCKFSSSYRRPEIKEMVRSTWSYAGRWKRFGGRRAFRSYFLTFANHFGKRPYQYSCLLYLSGTEEEEIRDAVLVADGDNEIGQVLFFWFLSFLSQLHLYDKHESFHLKKFNWLMWFERELRSRTRNYSYVGMLLHFVLHFCRWLYFHL